MPEGSRRGIYDRELKIEAFRFTGMRRAFPEHFHQYYVIGLMEGGERVLRCQKKERLIGPGDLLLFNPGDSHGCAQRGGSGLDYRGLHIGRERMAELTERITGRRELPRFSPAVVRDGEAACCLGRLHAAVCRGAGAMERQEGLLLLLALLLERYRDPLPPLPASSPAWTEEVEAVCRFLEEGFSRKITLEQLCRLSGLSPSTLLRAFVKNKGITPYRYLENIRVGRARELLERGIPPAEAALRTGFSDQSHLTAYFTRFIGLPPGAYQEIFSESGKDHDSTE